MPQHRNKEKEPAAPNPAPAQVTPHPVPYGQACAGCAKAKCRCRRSTASPAAPCDRCQRLKRSCEPARTNRKRGVGGQRNRTAKIEEKLESLVNILIAQGQKPVASSDEAGSISATLNSNPEPPYGSPVFLALILNLHIADKIEQTCFFCRVNKQRYILATFRFRFKRNGKLHRKCITDYHQRHHSVNIDGHSRHFVGWNKSDASRGEPALIPDHVPSSISSFIHPVDNHVSPVALHCSSWSREVSS